MNFQVYGIERNNDPSTQSRREVSGAQDDSQIYPETDETVNRIREEDLSDKFCLFRDEWSPCQGYKIFRADIALVIMYILIWLFVVFLVTPIDKSQLVSSDRFNEAAGRAIYPCLTLFLVVGIIFIKLPLTTAIMLGACFLFLLFPILFLSTYIAWYITNWDNVNYSVLIWMTFVPSCFIYWLWIRCTRDCCNKTCGGSFWGVCGVTVVCYITIIVLLLLIQFKLIFPEDSALFQNNSEVIRGLFGLLLLMIWGFIQYSCLYQTYGQYQNQIDREQNRQQQILLQLAGGHRFQENESRPTQASICEKSIYFGNLIGNFLLGIMFVAIEIILLGELEDRVDDQDTVFYAEIFVTLFILIVMIVFIPLSASSIRVENKQLYSVLLFTFASLMIIAGSYEAYIKDKTTLKLLIDLFLVIIPIFAVYMATLNYVRACNDNLYRAYLTVSGFGFILPITISYTFYWIDHWDLSSTWVIVGIILFAVCGVICLIAIVVIVIMKIREVLKIGKNFVEFSFSHMGNLINTTGGALGIGILIYVYLSSPDIPTLRRSGIFALTFFITFLTLCLNLVLRIKVPAGIASHHLNSLFSNSADLLQDKYEDEPLFQKIGLVVGIIIFPIIFLLLYFILSSKPFKYFFLAMIIISVGTAILFIFLLELRKIAGIYSKNFLPLCISFVWIIVFFPLCVGAPAAIIYWGDTTENFRYIIGVIISFSSIILMIGVSIGAIVLNYIFKQMERERMAKFCVSYIKKELSKIAVKSYDDLLRLLFDQHKKNQESGNNGDEVLSEALHKALVAYWWPIPERDPDISHNRVLIDLEKYNKLKESEDNNKKNLKELGIEKKEEKQEKKEVKFCCDFCYESDEEEENEPINFPPKEEEKIIIEPPKNSTSIIDFKYILEMIARDSLPREGQMAGYYVKPYNAIKGNYFEEQTNQISYQRYLDIIEDRTVNSDKLLELLLCDKLSLQKFYDQVFRFFAHGSLSEYPYYWMTLEDFLDFSLRLEIIDTNSLNESQIQVEKQDLAILYMSLTQDTSIKMNIHLFYQALEILAEKKFPNERNTSFRLLQDIIYPAIFASVPHLINEQFAKNILDEKFKVRGLYPEDQGGEIVEQSYRPLIIEKNKYGCGRKICICLNHCLNSILGFFFICFGSFAACIKGLCSCFSTEERKEEEIEQDTHIYSKKSLAMARSHLPVAEWPQIVETIISSINKGLQLFESKNIVQELEFNFNMANLTFVASELFGCYSIASLAFDGNVGWNFPSITSAILSYLKMNSNSSTKSSSNNIYLFFFWVSFILCPIYVLIAIPTARRARLGNLGLDSNGQPASLLSCEFVFFNILNVLGSGLYLTIIKNLLDALACDYESEKWTTYVQSGLTCWEGIHYLYVCCALLGILCYYPMATFMFPNLQFQNKMLDLKFYPSFLILYSQGKLFISGLGCFWNESMEVVLIFSSVTMFVTGILCIKIQACLVKKANLWFATIYFATGWITLGGAIMCFIQRRMLCLLFIVIGVILIFIIAFTLYRMFYNNNGICCCFNMCDSDKHKIEPEKRMSEMKITGKKIN